jgi:hypothetical protein
MMNSIAFTAYTAPNMERAPPYHWTCLDHPFTSIPVFGEQART